MRKRVYIAGPIGKGDLAHNVNQATAAFVTLAKAGFAPLCPHWSVYSKPCAWSHFGDGVRVECVATVQGNDEMDFGDWMGVDLPWVAVSDALLRLPGESVGADLEEKCARENGVPVFHSVEALVAFFAVPTEFAVEAGEWGALPNEPCRFCRRPGGVYFRVDDSPRGKNEPQCVRCDKCGRSWEADSTAA